MPDSGSSRSNRSSPLHITLSRTILHFRSAPYTTFGSVDDMMLISHALTIRKVGILPWTPLSLPLSLTNDCSLRRCRACQELDLIKDQMSQQSSKEVQLEEEVAFVCGCMWVRAYVCGVLRRVCGRGG